MPCDQQSSYHAGWDLIGSAPPGQYLEAGQRRLVLGRVLEPEPPMSVGAAPRKGCWRWAAYGLLRPPWPVQVIAARRAVLRRAAGQDGGLRAPTAPERRPRCHTLIVLARWTGATTGARDCQLPYSWHSLSARRLSCARPSAKSGVGVACLPCSTHAPRRPARAAGHAAPSLPAIGYYYSGSCLRAAPGGGLRAQNLLSK